MDGPPLVGHLPLWLLTGNTIRLKINDTIYATLVNLNNKNEVQFYFFQ